MGFRLSVGVFLLALSLIILPIHVTALDPAKFVRVNLQFDSGEIRLLDASIHSGVVRSRRSNVGHRSDQLLMKVRSDQGKILFEETFPDPRILFFDEPGLTGQLQGGMIQNNNGVASVVFPFHKNSHSIDFFHRLFGPEEEGALRVSRMEKLNSVSIAEIKGSMRARKVRPAIPAVNIQKTGKSENRIDMVFLAEGYTASQRTSFLRTVRKVVSSWRRLFPWSEYFRLLNIYAVPLESQESGADHPGVDKNTALDAVYGCFDIPRLLCIDYDKALTAAAESVPQFDFAIAVVNDPEFGGSGGPVSVFSVNTEAQQIFFHEIAHTFASLADEYETANPTPPPFTEQLYPNVSKIKTRSEIKWRSWILPQTPVPTPDTLTDVIGIFVGAFFDPTEFVRPKADCLMRTLGVEFDAVCAEAHILEAFDRVSFIENATPVLTDIVLSRNSSQQFKINPAPLPLTRLRFEWFVNGVPQESKGSNFNLMRNKLAPGDHEVMVRITDQTHLVKTDPFNLRTDSVTWKVTIQ